MAESSEDLNRKIEGASELQSVVRTMKALSASSIGQFEQSVNALDDYYKTVELGLIAFLFQYKKEVYVLPEARNKNKEIFVIVFGSDQGLVGQFNDKISSYTMKTLNQIQGNKQIWAVGERVQDALSDYGFVTRNTFPVPSSINAITPLIAEILKITDLINQTENLPDLYLFYNRPSTGSLYIQAFQRLLPLDSIWEQELVGQKWATRKVPQVIGESEQIFKSLIGEFLFVSLFRACAESLTSENISRLSAMQRAEKNIEELLDHLKQEFHILRQNSIDEELFDVISGFESQK